MFVTRVIYPGEKTIHIPAFTRRTVRHIVAIHQRLTYIIFMGAANRSTNILEDMRLDYAALQLNMSVKSVHFRPVSHKAKVLPESILHSDGLGSEERACM